MSRKADVMKRPTFFPRLVAIASAALLVYDGTSGAAQESPGPATSAASSVPAIRLSPGVEDLLKLSRAKVGDDVIVAFVHDPGRRYNLTADEIVYLRKEGLSDRVLAAMLSQSSRRAAVTPAPQPVAPATATPSTPSASGTQSVVIPTTPSYQTPSDYAPAPATYVASEPTTYNYYPSYPYYGYSYPYYGYPIRPSRSASPLERDVATRIIAVTTAAILITIAVIPTMAATTAATATRMAITTPMVTRAVTIAGASRSITGITGTIESCGPAARGTRPTFGVPVAVPPATISRASQFHVAVVEVSRACPALRQGAAAISRASQVRAAVEVVSHAAVAVADAANPERSSETISVSHPDRSTLRLFNSPRRRRDAEFHPRVLDAATRYRQQPQLAVA